QYAQPTPATAVARKLTAVTTPMALSGTARSWLMGVTSGGTSPIATLSNDARTMNTPTLQPRWNIRPFIRPPNQDDELLTKTSYEPEDWQADHIGLRLPVRRRQWMPLPRSSWAAPISWSPDSGSASRRSADSTPPWGTSRASPPSAGPGSGGCGCSTRPR